MLSLRQEEDPSNRFHVPRRRRFGFPPITPNACVRDAVLHQLFDLVWSRMVTNLSGNGRSKPSLLEVTIVILSTHTSYQYVCLGLLFIIAYNIINMVQGSAI